MSTRGATRHTSGRPYRLTASQTASLLDISRIISRGVEDTTAVLDTIARRLTGVLGDWCGIFTVSGDVGAMRLVAVHGPRPLMVHLVRSLMSDIEIPTGTIAEQLRIDHEPVLIQTVDSLLTRAAESAAGMVVRALPLSSVLLIPAVVHGVLRGLIACASDSHSPVMTEDDRVFASLVGGRVASVLEVAELVSTLEAALQGTLLALSDALAVRDAYTRTHSIDAARLALAVAERLGLDPETSRQVERAAILHDIGKLGVRDDILLKSGALSPEEREAIQMHPEIGAQILMRVPSLRAEAAMIAAHHERLDGTGYPRGLRGDEIPIGARILAVVDAYQAMISDRPYRRALTRDEALRELSAHAGTQFDPDIVTVVGALIRGSSVARLDGAVAGNAWERLASAVAAEINLHAVRRAIERYLLRAGLTGGVVDDVLVAATEAVANAVEHGSPVPSTDLVVIEGRVREGVAQVRVTSQRHDWELPPEDSQPPRSPAGHGIRLMRALVDDVAVEKSDGATKVVLSKRLPA